MGGHVLCVCVFCLLCATHSICTQDTTTERLKSEEKKNFNKVYSVTNKRHSDNLISVDNNNSNKKDIYLKKILQKYGDGNRISVDDFELFLNDLNHIKQEFMKSQRSTDSENETRYNSTCDDLKPIVQVGNITSEILDESCPALLYSVISTNCIQDSYVTKTNIIEEKSTVASTWMYSLIAVFLISACGILSVAIIPVMEKKFYKQLLQFLVALAVGTLAGDALLHLLPHAMTSSHHHSGGHGLDHHEHEEDHENMWKGFVAMLGFILFFTLERFIPLVHKWKRSRHGKEHSRVKVLNNGHEINHSGDTKCVDKYNAYPKCYKDIVDDPSTTFLSLPDSTTTRQENPILKKNAARQISHTKEENPGMFISLNKGSLNDIEANQNLTDCPHDVTSTNCGRIFPSSEGEEDSDYGTRNKSYTAILSEHGAVHHGHSHVHGHVHAAPQNLSSVAWMVIMGDGLHNFTDGMAIGAAFSSSTAGGFSTAVAVFCHELPHELGDFAMLLKTGMTIKQALFYNIISSILCVFGNILGIWLGHTEYASSWVFAVAAGTFLYIALVDMIPELSSAHEDEGNLIQCILHLSGLILGFGIMTLIALYEHDLRNIF